MRFLLAFFLLPILWLHASTETIVGYINSRIRAGFDAIGRHHFASAHQRLAIIAVGLGMTMVVLIVGVPIAILAGLWSGLERLWSEVEELVDDFVNLWRSSAPKVPTPAAPNSASAASAPASESIAAGSLAGAVS